MAGERILVVEDEAIVAQDLRASIERMGYTVVGTAVDGTTAIAMAMHDRPDLVVMDVGLEGELDGIEAAETILHRLGSQIVYVSGQVVHDTTHRVLDVEPVAFIAKPIRYEELQRTLQAAFGEGA